MAAAMKRCTTHLNFGRQLEGFISVKDKQHPDKYSCEET